MHAAEQALSCRLGMRGMDAFMDTSDLVDDADLEGQTSGLQPVRSFGQQEAAKLLSNMEGEHCSRSACDAGLRFWNGTARCCPQPHEVLRRAHSKSSEFSQPASCKAASVSKIHMATSGQSCIKSHHAAKLAIQGSAPGSRTSASAKPKPC